MKCFMNQSCSCPENLPEEPSNTLLTHLLTLVTDDCLFNMPDSENINSFFGDFLEYESTKQIMLCINVKLLFFMELNLCDLSLGNVHA